MEITNLFNAYLIIEFAIILFFSFIGSAVKVYLQIMKNPKCISKKYAKRTKNKMIEIILSTMTASVLSFAISGYIDSSFGTRGLVCVSFIMGLIGFDLLGRISTIDGLIEVLVNITKVYNSYKVIQNNSKSEEESDDEEEDIPKRKKRE